MMNKVVVTCKFYLACKGRKKRKVINVSKTKDPNNLSTKKKKKKKLKYTQMWRGGRDGVRTSMCSREGDEWALHKQESNL